jgi:hypothetical protein
MLEAKNFPFFMRVLKTLTQPSQERLDLFSANTADWFVIG